MLNNKVRFGVALFGSFINISMGTCSIKSSSFYLYCTTILPWNMFQSLEVIVERVLIKLEVASRFG